MSEQDIVKPENGKQRYPHRRSSHGFLGGFVLGALLGAAVTIGVGAYSHGGPGGWGRADYDTTAANKCFEVKRRGHSGPVAQP